MAKFEVYQSGKKNEFRFRLKADNGQIILSSEGYTTKTACVNAINSVKKNKFRYYPKGDSDNSQFEMSHSRIHIIRREEGWAIKKQFSQRAYKVCATKEEAKQSAKKFQKQGHDVIVHREDGTIETWEIIKTSNNA